MVSLNEIDLKKLVENVLLEIYDNTNLYTLIGYVKNSTVDYATGNFYVFIKNSVINSTDIEDIKRNLLVTRDESAGGSNYSSYFTYGNGKNFVTLIPEYKNTIIEHAIFGIPKEKRIELSKELINTIEREDGNALLRHFSAKKIVDGYVKIGMPSNSYSKSDFTTFNKSRVYFWGTKGGKDVSYGENYCYFCHLPVESIYPIQYDPMDLKNIDDILNKGYKAIAYYMGDKKEYGTVVVSFESLPIKYIKILNNYGKTFNADWEQI